MLQRSNILDHFRWSAAQLAELPLKERLELCPAFLCEWVAKVVEYLSPSTIWIFGSRVRVDHTIRSDYDLAVRLFPNFRGNWAAFEKWKEEELGTFLSIDCIIFDEASDKLQSEILKAGIVIYEKD